MHPIGREFEAPGKVHQPLETRLRPWLLAAALLAGSPMQAAAQVVQPPPAWAGSVDALVEEAIRKAGIPGAQVAISQDGRIVYSRGYGVADSETARPVTPATLFQVGSIAKTYTGILLSELAAEGRLDLRAPIASIVPELLGRPTGAATTHQLLTHTAGWADSGVPFGRTDDAALGETLLRVGDEWALTAPGRVFSYSNGGFAMAGYVAERATGTPFADLIDQRVLRRTGKDHPTFRPLVAMTRDFAQGHVAVPAGGVMVQRPMPSNSAEYPAGFLFATSADIARFGAALIDGGMLDGKRVFTERAVTQLTTGDLRVPGTADSRIGYGLTVGTSGGERLWRKSGSLPGYASELTLWPDRRFAVVTQVNRLVRSVPAATNLAIARIIHGIAEMPQTPQTESDGTAVERAEIAGTYRFSPTGVARIVDRDGQLVQVSERGAFPLRFLGKDHLILKAPDPIGREMFVLRDEKGEIEYLHAHSRAFVRER